MVGVYKVKCTVVVLESGESEVAMLWDVVEEEASFEFIIFRITIANCQRAPCQLVCLRAPIDVTLLFV